MKTLRNRADRLFSAYVRSKGRCEVETCQAPPSSLQCAHWIGRRYAWTRTFEGNAFCLCARHHLWFTDHPTEFGRWAINQRGEVTYVQLLTRSQKRQRFDWDDEVERLEKLCQVRGILV